MEGFEVLILVMANDSHPVLSQMEVIGNRGLATQILRYIVPECQICSKKGHIAPNCWKRSTNPNQVGQVVECQICGNEVIVPWIVIIVITLLIKA